MKRQELQDMKLEAKVTSIVEYLTSIGYEPVSKKGTIYKYHSPLRPGKDAVPSFDVDTFHNRWKDWGEDGKWWNDIITLVKRVENCDFHAALARLVDIGSGTMPQTLSIPKSTEATLQIRPEAKIKVLKVYPLTTRYLINYVTQTRKIALSLAKLYLSEALVYNINTRKIYPAVAFKTDAGSYELRSQFVKVAAGQKSITTIPQEGSSELNIFEGFFNFLSWLDYSELNGPKNTTIVLNGLSQLNSVLSKLNEYKIINSFVDLGSKGREAHQKICESHHTVIDQSLMIHPDFEDFNDFITNLKYNYSDI